MYVNRKKFKQLEEHVNLLLESVEQMKDKAFLTGIEREGGKNKFTFVRGKEIYQIETVGVISDNLPEWKEKLLR